MLCSCDPLRWQQHRGDCQVALAFKSRCPDCRSRKRPDGHIAHTYHCFFKGFDHRKVVRR